MVVVQVIVMEPVVMLMSETKQQLKENTKNKSDSCEQLLPPHTIQPIVIASGKFETQVNLRKFWYRYFFFLI